MSQLHMMVTITDRDKWRLFRNFYRSFGIEVTLSTVANGTAASEMLNYFGLEESEKVVILSFVTRELWRTVKEGLQKQLRIDVPGTGIAFLIPLSSIGGKKPLQFLTENQNFVKGEESTLQNTKYELLVVIANQGYTDLIMDAARGVGAAGGTVIHAKGTGMEGAERFLGVSLGSEKEMVFIVALREHKNNIMKAIMDKAGLESKARSIVFSLPVASTAGMRLMEDAQEDD